MEKTLIAFLALTMLTMQASAETRRPGHHKRHTEKASFVITRPAIGTVITTCPANGRHMKKDRTNYWIADRVVYRIDRIRGKKIYVVVKHLT